MLSLAERRIKESEGITFLEGRASAFNPDTTNNDDVRGTTLDLLNEINIQKLIDRDSGTWEEFVRLSRGFMRGIVEKKYRIDPYTAEDIYQKVFEKVIRGLESYRAGTGTKFTSWLGTVVENTCKDHFRSERRRPVVSFDVGDDSISDTISDSSFVFPSEELEAGGTLRLNPYQIIENAYLNKEDKEIMLLRAQGCSYKEIAKHMNLNINTLKSRIRRARKKLNEIREEL